MNAAPTEAELVERGLTAPRVTPDRISAVIKSEYFHRPPGTTLTLCVLTLRNGFTVTGTAACASPANFDPEIGERYAREDAKRQIWALEGYALRERLASSTLLRSFAAYLCAAAPELSAVEVPAFAAHVDSFITNGGAEALPEHQPEAVSISVPQTTARERAQSELAQLTGRAEGLERFMSTDYYRGLPFAQQTRLDVQLMHMKAYRDVLAERIADWVE